VFRILETNQLRGKSEVYVIVLKIDYVDGKKMRGRSRREQKRTV